MAGFTPFTYLIGWKKHDRWYYGVRYARNCHPDDLWTSYFTSSKEIQKFRGEYGEPDVIEVRQIFNDSLQAREWEHKVLRRLGVIQNDRWLNLGTGKAIPPRYGPHSKEWVEKRVKSREGYAHSEETRRKISIKNKGRKSPNLGKKMSEDQRNKLKGRKLSEETKIKIGRANKNRERTDEWRSGQSKRMTGENNSMYGKKQPIEICRYCGKIASKTNIKRWHNENCKNRGGV